MLAFEVFQMFSALRLHFTTSYDYFKYDGKVKGKIENFEKRKDIALFSRVAKMRNPETLIIGSVMLGNASHITQVNEKYQNDFERFLENGLYLFSEDLKKLKDDCKLNFSVDNLNSIPYIFKLYKDGEISLHTCCVLEDGLNLDAKWSKSDQYLIFENISKKMVKSAPFFKIDKAKYKALFLKRFQSY